MILIITTEHVANGSVPAHIRYQDTKWNINEYEKRDYTMSYHHQAQELVERMTGKKMASYGRCGVDVPENVWYYIVY